MKNLELGESIQTFDPAVALRGESGTFRVLTPGGEEFAITCKRDGTKSGSIQNLVEREYREHRPFTITKISEPVGSQEELQAA